MAAQIETGRFKWFKRRSFLGALVGLIVSSISAFLGVTIGRFSVEPAFSSSDSEEWMELGEIVDIPEDKLVRRSLVISQQAGWGQFNTQRLVWIMRKSDEFKVYSAVCPHLGCTVSARGERFICACHGSSWDVAGNKLGGPAPRALDLLEHRIEGNLLKVRYQAFKQGIATKEAV
ncbi:MAG: Rieske 2Fe-2S domain-containing protein [Acidobacteria bacterium]|nr:Rieske 2Fe-2S domain-containing protein [Acidobacteriota bacterium]